MTRVIGPAGLIVMSTVLWAPCTAGAQEMSFEGLKALVVEPENSWGWDSAIFGALEERHFDVAYGPTPDDLASLSGYDLVALNIRRSLTTEQAAALREYVGRGGAVYGAWGGPFGSPGFLRDVCKVAAWKSVWRPSIALLESPLTIGISADEIAFAVHVGHQTAGPTGWEVVALEPAEGGLPVARDQEGNGLGVLSEYGQGRTAVLGFGPEQEKYLTKPELGPRVVSNLLGWLLEEKLRSGPTTWSNTLQIALPTRAEIREVYLNEKRLPAPTIRQVGSLKKVEIDASECAEDQEASVHITYQPLSRARNVQTMIHLPWNTLRSAADSPGRLAEYLRSLNTTICQPLLRGPFGTAWYKGMPEDEQDDKLVKQYEGDFLADLIAECHGRGIKLIAGVYLDSAAPVRHHPDASRLDRQGAEVKDQYGRVYACFNNPLGQEHNLATIRDLLERYDVDGLVLDDNFELDQADCYCQYCKQGFKRYCADRAIRYEDPSQTPPGSAVAGYWREYRREATRSLARHVSAVARARGVPAGGWVGVGMDATHLAAAFDFLGGMVYMEPPRAVRGPLSVLGNCGYVCLLWAPDASPETMEREVREAVHAGSPVVGFWIRGDDGSYQMDAEASQAISRAFAGVEKEWLRFYEGNVVCGDPRFAVLEGKVDVEELRLRVQNTGQKTSGRIRGRLDLSALE